jgi:hypothetical protein
MKNDPLLRLQLRTLADAALILREVREPKTLTNKLRARLIRAFRDEILVADYSWLVRQISESVELPNGEREQVTIVFGGVLINRDRDPMKPHFRRIDNAWFDFHMIVRPYAGDIEKYRGCLELVAYGYEIRFPNQLDCDIRWLRFDLNLPGPSRRSRPRRPSTC